MAERTRWWALTAVSLATLMTYLDNNIVNVALPTIESSLHVGTSGLEWIVSSYLLVLGGLLLVGGRIADVYGRRRMFLAGLVIFTLSSLAAGLAGSGGVLIAARAVQGLGAALILPASLAIIAAAFTDPRERTTAIGISGAIGALGLALGPVLGGGGQGEEALKAQDVPRVHHGPAGDPAVQQVLDFGQQLGGLGQLAAGRKPLARGQAQVHLAEKAHRGGGDAETARARATACDERSRERGYRGARAERARPPAAHRMAPPMDRRSRSRGIRGTGRDGAQTSA